MESQHQNPEFRNDSENSPMHKCKPWNNTVLILSNTHHRGNGNLKRATIIVYM